MSALKIVRIKVPAGALNKIETAELITRNVLKQLGCLGCHSGFQLQWDQEQILVANLRGEVHEEGALLAGIHVAAEHA